MARHLPFQTDDTQTDFRQLVSFGYVSQLVFSYGSLDMDMLQLCKPTSIKFLSRYFVSKCFKRLCNDLTGSWEVGGLIEWSYLKQLSGSSE